MRELVAKAVGLLRENYIFPDKAEHAATTILAELEAGAYDGLDEDTLGAKLTDRLYQLCGDWHVRVRARDAALRESTSPQQARELWLERSRLDNYGVAKIERLDGNVGYLDLTQIAYPGAAGRTIAAAMELVSHTFALLIDLRRCRGGSPHGVIFWNSYLFADGDTHLNDIYDGASGETRQFWSATYVPGERYLDRPVYVLTSGATFSGAEEFAYNLKNQGRATLVGETTRGGAHPTDSFPITPTLEITVPTARSINPVSGTNWEGTGVEPNIAVPPGEALPVAYREALRHVITVATDSELLEQAHAALADELLFNDASG